MYLDSEFLLGPEAAHLNITGVSGLATKTSSIEFVLLSIFEHFRGIGRSIAVVCFNVKGPDMLFLDFPGACSRGSQIRDLYAQHGIGNLDESDLRMYDRLGIPCEPFRA